MKVVDVGQQDSCRNLKSFKRTAERKKKKKKKKEKERKGRKRGKGGGNNIERIKRGIRKRYENVTKERNRVFFLFFFSYFSSRW